MSDLCQGVCWRLGQQRKGFARCYLSDEEFDAAAIQAGVATEIETLFEKTKPRWYGLWLGPSLTAAQCRVLVGLFTAGGLASGAEDAEWDITVPLRSALAEGVPLQVEASTPGHSDCGHLTTFVHCPRCRCEGPFPRWKESYPADIHFCGCCGHAYSPASSYSSVSEYSLNSFECTGCGQVVKGDTLNDEQLQTLERHDLHEQEIQEFDWLERIAAFYRRYPEAAAYFESRGPAIGKGVSVTFRSDVRFSPDDLLNSAGNGPWMSENAAVMEYLERHFFALERRRRFVMQALNAWSMEERVSVRCVDCGAELKRRSSPD